MKHYHTEVEENCSKEAFQKIIEQFLPKNKVIYTIIPEYYKEFLLEISSNFVEIKNIVDDKYSFPKSEGILGYINDDELQFVFEFYERANVIPFVIASRNVTFEEDVELDSFYSYFEGNNIPHITVGPDQEYITYYSDWVIYFK